MFLYINWNIRHININSVVASEIQEFIDLELLQGGSLKYWRVWKTLVHFYSLLLLSLFFTRNVEKKSISYISK